MVAGLHPTLSLHHHNQYNAFPLADDLMEPFRPIVDAAVKNLSQMRETELNAQTKQILVSLLSLDFSLNNSRSPLTTCLETYLLSLVNSYNQQKPELSFPQLPQLAEIQAIGNAS